MEHTVVASHKTPTGQPHIPGTTQPEPGSLGYEAGAKLGEIPKTVCAQASTLETAITHFPL